MYHVPPPAPPANLTCPRCGGLAMTFWQKALMLRSRPCRSCGLGLRISRVINIPIALVGGSIGMATIRLTNSLLLVLLVSAAVALAAGVFTAHVCKLVPA